MKSSKWFGLIVLGAILTLGLPLGLTGCKKTQPRLTNIPGGAKTAPGTRETAPRIDDTGSRVPQQPRINSEPIVDANPGERATSARELFDNMVPDPTFFKANTVYFDYDSSVVKTSHRAKIEEVAVYLKSSSAADQKILIEGHCDERGTEEYNRALGERRALSLREYLVRLKISPDRIRTISYGEDRPADPGHTEASWSKNRRGEFILLKPK